MGRNSFSKFPGLIFKKFSCFGYIPKGEALYLVLMDASHKIVVIHLWLVHLTKVICPFVSVYGVKRLILQLDSKGRGEYPIIQ